MAIYHFSAKTVSRAQGRSATGAAAYRSATRIMDARTGEIFDFTRKRGVVESRICLPAGATADRAELWNKVEAHHKRGDAVVAREFIVALPAELSVSSRAELAIQYAQELSERYKVAVDVAIHEPGRDGDNRNHHAHILMSACYCDAAMALGKKAVELDPIHCQRAKIANSVDAERVRWQDLVNAALEQAGQSARVDHRTLEAQGVTDRAPGVHLGPAASGIERRGEASKITDRERAKVAEVLAQAQADAAIQIAAERDIKELEAQLEKLRDEIKQQEKTQELTNVYFTHTPKQNAHRPGGLSTHGLRVLSECDMAPDGSKRGQGAENADLLHIDERADRSTSDRVRRVPEPSRRVEKMEEMQVDPVSRMKSLRNEIVAYQDARLAGPMEARARAMEARNRAHRRDLVEKAHEDFTRASRERKRTLQQLRTTEYALEALPFWRPLKKFELKKELEEARQRLADQGAAIEKTRDMAHRPILEKCDLAIEAADAAIEAAQVGLEPLQRELQELERQAAEQQSAREEEAARLAEEIKLRREEERAKKHAQRVAESKASPAYESAMEARRRAADAAASREHNSGPARR